jgi:hypothetical protein
MFTENQRHAQQHVRGLIWWFYADLKAYRMDPTAYSDAKQPVIPIHSSR